MITHDTIKVPNVQTQDGAVAFVGRWMNTFIKLMLDRAEMVPLHVLVLMPDGNHDLLMAEKLTGASDKAAFISSMRASILSCPEACGVVMFAEAFRVQPHSEAECAGGATRSDPIEVIEVIFDHRAFPRLRSWYAPKTRDKNGKPSTGALHETSGFTGGLFLEAFPSDWHKPS